MRSNVVYLCPREMTNEEAENAQSAANNTLTSPLACVCGKVEDFWVLEKSKNPLVACRKRMAS